MTVRIRQFHMDDLPALVSLWNATVWADPISQQRLLLDFILDPHFSPEHVWLAEADEKIVGFVFGMKPNPTLPGDNASDTGIVVAFGVADSYRRQGIGRQLFARLDESWTVKRVMIGPWIPTYLVPGVDERSYPAAAPFLAAIGYKEGGRPVSMRALLTNYQAAEEVEALQRAQAEASVQVRPANPADALPLLAFASSHFPHWEGYVRTALRDIIATPGKSTLHIALQGDRVLGFAQSTGERFGPFGVDESTRGQGIGAVLLSLTLQAMRANGNHVAYFLWTSDWTARLYGRHGFEIVRRFTMFSREGKKSE